MERCKDRIEYKEEKHTELLELDTDVLIPNMDSKGHMLWSKMKYVTRHDPDNELYEVTTLGGRKVTVTQYDSMLVWNPDKQEFLKKPTTDIKEGEFVPVTSKMPTPPVVLDKVDVSKYLPKTDFLYGSDFWKASQMMTEHMDGRDHVFPGWWNKHNGTDFVLPYPSKARLQRVMVRSDLGAIKHGYVYNYAAQRGVCSIPDTFPLDKEFGIFIGLYLAEGCCNTKSGKVSIANNDPNVKAFVKSWFEKYNIKIWEETKEVELKNAEKEVVSCGITCSIQGNSTMLAKFMDKFVGHGAANKFVPNEAFAAKEEFAIGIINGYFAGDGTVDRRGISASSTSERLIRGIAHLCSRLGAFGKIRKSQIKMNNLGTKNILPTFTLDIRSRFAERMRSKVDLIIDYKNERLKNLQCSMSHRNFPEENDVVMDAVKSITPVDVTNHPKVYDVTVPGTYNFMISSGLNQHDTSETGYIQRRLVKAMEDAKIYYDQTVRNAGGSVIQFIYGEDGMEGTKVEKQYIPTIELDMIELDTKYHLRSEDTLQIHMHPESFKRMSKDKDWMKRCTEHFKSILEDREYLIQHIFQGEKENKIIYPIPFDRILKNARARISDAGLDGVPSDLTPSEILDEIDRLCEKLYINVPKQGTRFLEILLRIHLSPKPMIMQYHMTKDIFKWIVEEIERRYYEAIAQAGEMVGIVAAQSMGEPATQLSSSHDTRIRVLSGDMDHTGSYNGEIGRFIDRLMEKNKKDVIDLGNNSTVLYLQKDYHILGVSNDEKTSWRRILQVSRHPANGGMVTVKTRSGRKTTATLSHSFLKRTDNGIVPIEGSQLKVGDRIPVAYKIPEIENPIREVEIGDKDYKLDRDFGWIVGAYLADGNATSNIKISKIEPVFEEKIRAFSLEKGFTLTVRHTEGTIDMDPRYADRVYIGKDMTIGGKGICKLAQWFSENFGNGSYNKKIPAWVYASNKEFIAGILSGYFDGDGNVNVDKYMIRCHSVCEGLIDDIAVLLSYCGMFASKLKEIRKREKANLLHVLSINRKFARQFKETVGFIIDYKAKNLDELIKYNERDNKHSDQEMIDKIPECGESIAYIGNRLKLPGQSRLYRRWLKKEAIGRRTLEKYVTLFKAANDVVGNLPDVTEHINKLDVALNSDVVWDEIIKLEYLPDPDNYVYDFTVPGNDSFMVDTGVLVHNTLDSFHSSGTAAAVKATSGVPRLKELLSVTKNIKTPSLKVHFKKDIGTVINPPENKESTDENNPVFVAKNRVKTLMHKFEVTRISDILDMSEIFWDPPGDTGLYTGVEDDNGLLELYRIFERINTDECYSRSPWVLRMRLNKEKMHAQNITMLDIYTNIEKTHGDSIECIFSDDNAEELIFRIRIQDNKIKDIDIEDAVAALKAVEFNIVNNVILKGIDGIKKGSLRMLENNRYNPETMSFQPVVEWIMDTDGTNLESFLSNPNIDKTRTVSNDVCEIYKTLGIEAARVALYNEIMEVIRESSVNYRHIALLIDTITNRGTLMSVDRHGINRGDVGPLAKSSFEETTNMLIDASIFSEFDKINGVSANIMLGQLPPCGTGDSEILLDEERFEELLKELPQKPTLEIIPEKEEIEFQEPCRPQNIAFNFEMPTASKNVSKMPEPKINFI